MLPSLHVLQLLPPPFLPSGSFTTSKRVVDEMVVSLARCKRPKLKVLLDVALGRRKRAASTPHTFCKFEEVGPEALQLVEQ
jgi:hypothetical protein